MGGATDVLGELLVQGVLAALVVESLIHWLPVDTPVGRFPYRVTALLAPVLLAVVFGLVAPFRREAWFQDVSVFVSGRWELLRLGPLDARTAGLVVAAASGALLLARDLLHAAFDAWRVWRREAHVPRVAPPPALSGTVVTLAREMDLDPPALDLLVSRSHALHCRGWRRPRIVMSTGTLEDLDDPQLRAALAHELAHISHHDVFRGWILLALRTLQWFNPVAQAIGRRAAQELEWRADDRAGAVTGNPIGLAKALVRCARSRGDRFLGVTGQGRFRTLEERCRRLMRGGGPPEARCGPEMIVLWTGLTVLLVFVQ